MAEELVDAGYRKIPEGAVVLEKKEYDRLKRVEAEKDRLYEIKLDLENQLIEKGFTEYVGADEIEKEIRKETVEKIADWLDNEKGYCGLGYLIKREFCTEGKDND